MKSHYILLLKQTKSSKEKRKKSLRKHTQSLCILKEEIKTKTKTSNSTKSQDTASGSCERKREWRKGQWVGYKLAHKASYRPWYLDFFAWNENHQKIIRKSCQWSCLLYNWKTLVTAVPKIKCEACLIIYMNIYSIQSMIVA